MVQDLIIVGAGGMGRDLVWVIDDLNRIEPRWTVVGFLDDDEGRAGHTVGSVPVLGPISKAATYTDCKFVLAVASYQHRGARRQIASALGLPDRRFATLVHPSAHVAPSAELGAGTVVLHNAVVQQDTQLGRHVIVSRLASVGHDAVLEDAVTLAAGALVCGSSRLGADVYVGAGAVVRDGATVGAGALVGVGAVVTRPVEPAMTVLGNPAKPLAKSRG